MNTRSPKTAFVFAACLLAAVFVTPTSAADPIVPTGPIRTVHANFAFTEGPAAMDDGTLFFTDIPNATIHRVSPTGELSVLTDDSNYANGLFPLSPTKLLACEMDGAVVQYDLSNPDAPVRSIIVDTYDGKRFNACNDLVVDQHGGLYFTDPQYRAPEPLPQTERCVYYVADFATSPVVTRLTGDIAAPNGIALSPDGKTLYVAPSMQADMLAFDVTGPGQIGPARVLCTLAQAPGETAGGGDGMAVDVNGNLYFTTALGVQIFSPAGEAKGTIEFPEHPANVTFGGTDFRTMYVTARTSLYAVEMPIAGFREFPAN